MDDKAERLVRLDAALRERLGATEYRRLYLRMLGAKRAFDTLAIVAPDIVREVFQRRKQRRTDSEPDVPTDAGRLFAELLARLPDEAGPAAKAVLKREARRLHLVK